MKIMFISWAFPPNYTGIGSYTANMAEALTAIGHQVIILTGKVNNLPEREETKVGLVLRCYRYDKIGCPELAKYLATLIHKYDVDLIECSDFLGEAANLLRIKNRPPVLIKSHNCGPIRIGRESEVHYSWQRWMQWAALVRTWRQFKDEKYSLTHGDLFATPSSRLMLELEKQGFKLPEIRAVIPNPIFLPENQPNNRESKNPTILFVGRLAMGKGIASLPSLMEFLCNKNQSVKLVIAGGDSYARGIGSLQKWLEEKFGKRADCVEFTGHLGRTELQKRFDEAWVVIVPSKWDTFPTVVLESMARGKPVVASPYGGMKEMLDGTLCSIADPASDSFCKEILKLLNDDEFRQMAGRSMFQKALTTYSPKSVANDYMNFVSKFIDQ